MSDANVSMLIERLALACARGYLQEKFVAELLAGPVRVWQDYSLGYRVLGGYTRYGTSKIASESVTALKKRLKAVGFKLEQTRTTGNERLLVMSLGRDLTL